MSRRVYKSTGGLRLAEFAPLTAKKLEEDAAAEYAKRHIPAENAPQHIAPGEKVVKPSGMEIVNVLGLDYVVPRDVALHLAELRKAVSAMVEKNRELQDLLYPKTVYSINGIPVTKEEFDRSTDAIFKEAATDARWKNGVEEFSRQADCHEND